MSTPFTGDLTGSWLFVRTEGADHTDRQIYHFMVDGSCRGEFDLPDGRRSKARFGYRCGGGTLTLIFLHNSSESHYPVTLEDDGAVRVHGSKGINWCMVRLAEPLPYSRAFVDAEGRLQKTGAGES